MRKNEMMSVLRPNQFQSIQPQAKLIEAPKIRVQKSV
jgi:hypothetical protein